MKKKLFSRNALNWWRRSWSVDGVRPVHVFRKHEPAGAPYLGGPALRAHGSLWNGESWAAQGGRVKTNWSRRAVQLVASTADTRPPRAS